MVSAPLVENAMIVGDLKIKTELNKVEKHILHKYNFKQIYNYNSRLLDN